MDVGDVYGLSSLDLLEISIEKGKGKRNKTKQKEEGSYTSTCMHAPVGCIMRACLRAACVNGAGSSSSSVQSCSSGQGAALASPAVWTALAH
jgi:hypothetical protein